MLNYTLVRFHGSRVPVLNKLVKIESHDVANNDDIRQLVQLYRTRSSASADGARSELLQKASKCNVFTVKKLYTINEIFVNMHDIYYKKHLRSCLDTLICISVHMYLGILQWKVNY